MCLVTVLDDMLTVLNKNVTINIAKDSDWRNIMYYDKLRDYKKIILKDRKINIFLLVMESLPVPFIAWAMLKAFHAIFILLVLLLLILLSIKWLTDNNHLLKQLAGIEKNNALNKTSQHILHYPKIAFLRVPKFEPHPSLSPEYYGIRILDGNKNKYYYFFEEPLRHDKDSINKIIKKFNRELSIQCYENTFIIKTIEKVPYFIHIRNGLFRE